jgi:enterochelin esterase-like enzyme
MNFWEAPVASLRQLWRRQTPGIRQVRHLYSPSLDREVDMDIYLPPDYRTHGAPSYPLLLLNDAQDLPRMDFSLILERLYQSRTMPYIIVAAIHANHLRIREYGTARQPDYKGRGDLAGQYREFIMEELMPYMHHRFRVYPDASHTAIAGFSLGGLSAMDIGWSAPEVFGKVGVFSGALWWRWNESEPNDPDAARIIHDIVRNTNDRRPNHQCFWFQCGTDDEEDDRNNNGVIDAIDDTIDLIRELQVHGYPDAQIRYLEIEDGRHDPTTWGVAMPDFLRWAFVPMVDEG